MITEILKEEMVSKDLIPSYREIAKACNCSVSTVSNVMNGISKNRTIAKYILNIAVDRKAEMEKERKIFESQAQKVLSN